MMVSISEINLPKVTVSSQDKPISSVCMFSGEGLVVIFATTFFNFSVVHWFIFWSPLVSIENKLYPMFSIVNI